MENNELEELAARELDALGIECVLCEVVGSKSSPVVRLYIDKPGGVRIKDCTLASRTVGLLLEKEDPFPGRYLLEVSSPGNHRPLRTQSHFERFAGSSAKVQVLDPGGDKNTYTGQIQSCINDVLTLDTDDGPIEIRLREVVKASLVGQEYKIDKKMGRERKRARRAKKSKDD